MKLNRVHAIAMAVAALGFPVAVRADISGTVNLSSGTALSLDTGASSSTGGDILWTGSAIAFQGSAKGTNLGAVGAEFSMLTLSTLQPLAAAAKTTPLPASDLVPQDVFVVSTNKGNTAKVLVTAASGTSITLQYTTYGATGGGTTPGAPTVTSVVNNYSFTPNGFPNSGVSPGSLITIFGSGLAAAPTGTVTLQSSASPGIPKTLSGATISVTVGGQTVAPAMYYAIPSQIAAVLPSSTPTGTGTLTVTYNNAISNAFTIQVVPAALGLDTYYGTGSGLITATDATTGALFNYTNSASPGQTIVLWGSGLGADTPDSDTVFSTSPKAVNQSITQVYFGDVVGTVLYAGSSGYPGVNQINVTIPTSVALGCGVSVVAVVGSGASAVPSNFGTIPIAQGGGSCTDSSLGITGAQIGTLSSQGTVKSGALFVGQLVSVSSAGTATNNFAAANFSSSTGSSFDSTANTTSIGSCVVSQTLSVSGVASSTGLDAGSIGLTGPLGSYSLMATATGAYIDLLPSGAIPSTGGAFTYSGSGGADVGSFTTTINLPNPLLTWTNQSAAATIVRSQGLLVTWSGGAPGSFLIITGNASSSGANGSFTCHAPQSAGSFMVPSYVLQSLPAGSGNVMVENVSNFAAFTAKGLDNGIAFGFTGAQINSTFQ